MNFLSSIYGGFHDAYINKVKISNMPHYKAKSKMVLIFAYCWVKPFLEMKFSGIERINLVNEDYQSSYSSLLSLYDNKILFADDRNFDTTKIEEESKKSTFIIADKLGWRLIEFKQKFPSKLRGDAKPIKQ